MPRTALLVGAIAVSLVWVAHAPGASAQVPQAGAAGAGPSAISGIPNGPANPAVLSDPSGIGNANRLPPLGTNAPAPTTSYGSLTSQPSQVSPSRQVMPSYTNGSSRFSARASDSSKPLRRRGRAQTSSFTGICRGC